MTNHHGNYDRPGIELPVPESPELDPCGCEVRTAICRPPAEPESPEPEASQVKAQTPAEDLPEGTVLILCNHPRPNPALPCADCGEKLGIFNDAE